MSRFDPIRKSHYDAVAAADTWSDWIFYLSAALSLLLLFVNQVNYPVAFDWIQYLFLALVVVLFAVGITLRLYLVPRAEGMRRQDFFSSAMNAGLTHQRTDGYYNNDVADPSHRIAAQVLENSHFSKAILLRMLRTERVKLSVYLLVWVLCLAYRRSDLGWIVVATQTVFGEQLFSKWLRMEWLRRRCEETFDRVFALFQAGGRSSHFDATAMDAVTAYEAAKANAGIVLSSTVFNRMNSHLSVEWDHIKEVLKIK